MKKNFSNDILMQLALDGNSDTVLDSLPVGVEIYAPDGMLLYMNNTDAQIFGVNRSDIMTARLNLHDNPNLPPQVKEAFIKRLPIHERTPYNIELASDRKYYSTQYHHTIEIEYNGQPIFGADGQCESYVFIIENVTEFARQEKEIAQNRQKVELALRESGIMLWEFDVATKIFYSDNEPLNGYDKSKPIQITTYEENVHPDDREGIHAFMLRMLSGEDFSYSCEVRVRFPDISEWQYCTISGSPFERDTQGRVVQYVGTRKNNTELQRKKMLQETILNSIPLPIHIKDIEDNFRYVFCNEESKQMFGSGEDKTTYDVMDAEQVARIEKTDKEVFATGEPYFGLERIVLKDGRSYDTIVRKSIIEDGGRRLLLNIRWDQSLQNELERRAKLLSFSMEAMDAYSWFFAPDENAISFGEGFDRPGRDIMNLNSLDKFVAAIHPDDREKFTHTIGETIAKQVGRWDVEYRIDLNESGTYEWWQTRGLLETTVRDEVPYKFMYGMSINIESHKQTEMMLRRNKEELDSLIRQNELVLNNTNSGLAYITTDYIVQWENVSICSKSLSYEAYKKGEPCYKSAHGRTSPCENCVMQRAILSRQTEQIKFQLNNNHTVEVFATPVLSEDQVDGVVIRVDDITEREHIFEELSRARALAEQSDKLKSAFLANMSHEIRTPLNAIVGFSELLINSPESDDRDEYIRIINDNNELLLKLINDILDLSKLEAGSVELKYEEFDLAEHFNGMAAAMNQRVKNPNVRLIAVNPHTTCRVQLDKNRIAQILTNYVTNAIKYTPKGFIEMGYTSSDDGIRFYVRDSGIGIPDEKKNKVFHRFEKLDEFAQGTGLGLSICKAIAESMGGSVGFESHFGEGSMFWAFLPCTPQTTEDRVAESPTAHPDRSHRVADCASSKRTLPKGKHLAKVLIAEDIPSNYLLVSSLLREHYDLIHAENGEQAVELARDCHPDLILMDMKMPVLDGMQATEQIRTFDTQTPIVALTAHAFDTDRQAALAIGCNDYLVKPINKGQLTTILEMYCPSQEPQNK